MIDGNKPQPSNMTKLAIQFATLKAVPKDGGFLSALSWLQDPERMKRDMREAIEEAKAAVEAIKRAPNNPYGNDDEVIAGAILAEAEKKKRERPH